MDSKTNFTSSFVPKKPLTERKMSGGSLSLSMTISLVVLGAALVFLAGAYGYQYFLLNQINRPCNGAENCGLRAQLEIERTNLNLDEIIRLSKLDLKLDKASDIINSHTSLIPLLSLIEKNTVHSVKFDSFDYFSNTLELAGEAKSYEDIAVLANTFQSTEQFSEISFSDFTITPTGNVEFSMSAQITEDLLKTE